MKKRVITLLAGIFICLSAGAQVQPHAIGVRGDAGNYGGGGELSYQHGFGSANRLEVDLGWRGNYRNDNDHYQHFGLTAVYHWVWNIQGGLNWFAGLGGQVGFYSYKNDSSYDGVTLGVGGQIGIVFDFNEIGAPIQLGLDARPMWGIMGGNSGFGYGGALSLRYTF